MTEQSSASGWSPELEALDGAFAVPYLHRLRFTNGAFDAANLTLRNLMSQEGEEAEAARTLVFVDEGVARAWPRLLDAIEHYANIHADRITLADRPTVVTGGEAAKNDRSVYDLVTRAIHEKGICRHSFVVAVGGGAMLDAVGFAVATAHRGVRIVRLPTTTLAQGDSGVGVKNGINAFGKKNFLGAFSPPWAVINDESFLATLSDRDWRCGLSEALKVALLKSDRFFAQIVEATPRLRQRDDAVLIPIIRRSAWQHLHHITDSGDPFELREARPLDFGHWSAHKLEQMTAFDLRHGEAVAIGIALDTIYSAMTGLLEWSDVKRVLDCLTALGFELGHIALEDGDTLLEGLDEFREHLGGRLTITLLNGIGSAVDVHEIDHSLMAEAARRLSTEVATGSPARTLSALPESPERARE